MSKHRSRKMTGNVPLAEPDPQQLHLSDESEEEEEEKPKAEDIPMHIAMPTMMSSHSMNMNEHEFATESGEHFIPTNCRATRLAK